jgi:hypothetical protein
MWSRRPARWPDFVAPLTLDPRSFLPGDFAPGDRVWADSDEVRWSFRCIRSVEDPCFATAFTLLEQEFGPLGEMEHREVIARRLARWTNPPTDAVATGAWSAWYEMVLAFEGEEPAAVRDHTVIFPPPEQGGGTLVHLSHNLVLPPWRRTGLAGWMRGCPAVEARLLREKLAPERREQPLLLVAEMEPWDESKKSTMIRLKAYEKAGFRMVDPACVQYFQPDFQAAEDGGPFTPLPLCLLLRWVGCEDLQEIPAQRVEQIADSLLAMYGLELSAANVAAARASRKILHPLKTIRLVLPTSQSADCA